MGVEGNEYVMEEVYPGESAMCEGRREGKCACLVVIYHRPICICAVYAKMYIWQAIPATAVSVMV